MKLQKRRIALITSYSTLAQLSIYRLSDYSRAMTKRSHVKLMEGGKKAQSAIILRKIYTWVCIDRPLKILSCLVIKSYGSALLATLTSSRLVRVPTGGIFSPKS